ncbi:MAG: hypothetical protein IKE90_02595 [Bacilli bacterium]|nr:hypothetical protein [Bacilli bacterium]
MKSKRDKRNYIIIGLCMILAIMGVGYAAFSQLLTINGTANITNSWNIEITNIRGVNLSSVQNNGAFDKEEPQVGSDKVSATFHTGLIQPGDTRIYEVEVTNKGSVDADITSVFKNTLSDAIYFSYDGVGPLGGTGTDVLTNAGVYNTDLLTTEEPFSLPTNTNNVRYIYITVKYRESVTSQPSNLEATINLELNSEQAPSNREEVDYGPHYLKQSGLEIPIVKSGDGLYYDSNTGEHYYRGANPDNYIEFEGNIWRILRFDTTGIKIITDEYIDMSNYEGSNASGTGGKFDIPNARKTENNSYCTNPTVGCNVWVATDKMNESPAEFVNGTHHGTVTEDSSLYTYLNGEYYNNILNKNSLIIDGTFNIGPISRESSYTWTGKVALIDSTEVSNVGSYLYKSYGTWTITPDTSFPIDRTRFIWRANNNLNNASITVDTTYRIRPVLYLTPNITLTGNGTNDENIYRIVS